MKKRPPADLKTTRAPKPLKSTKVGFRILVFYDSVLEVLGIDPATEPADRPKTVTVKRAQELTGLCERTVFRMIAAGRAEQESRADAA
jgi:hypothetical protein